MEKVPIGTQTEVDKAKEQLEDTVTAFQMQNKFLNKVRITLNDGGFIHIHLFQEVLELNQLRQQAIDREQKLFIEVKQLEEKKINLEKTLLIKPRPVTGKPSFIKFSPSTSCC